MNLAALTNEQIANIIANLAAELARRASTAQPTAPPVDPMQAMLLSLAGNTAPVVQQAQQAPHFVPERTVALTEPPKVRALGAGANGRDGSPPPSLAGGPLTSFPPASRGFPPGTVYANANTDPELARRFGILPPRGDDDPPMQGTGNGVGQVNLEPHRG